MNLAAIIVTFLTLITCSLIGVIVYLSSIQDILEDIRNRQWYKEEW